MQNRFNGLIVLLMLGTALSGCSAVGYGPKQDYSKFVSAKLAEDGCTALWTFHHFVYRPATGIRAFPDGGIPKYLIDVNAFGVYDLEKKKLQVLFAEKNRQWQHGSGNLHLLAVKGNKALLSQGGQLKGPFKLHLQHYLCDFKTGDMMVLSLKEDMAERGRDVGEIHLVDGDGMILMKTVAVAKGSDGGSRQDGVVDQLWLRYPSGEYVLAATSRFYQEYRDGELIYWQPDTRIHYAFNSKSRAVREIKGYRNPPYVDVTRGVTPADGNQRIDYGTSNDHHWSYEPTGLEAELVKKAL